VDLSCTRVALEKTERKGGVGSKVKEEGKFQIEMVSLDNIR
jgi:hypothetical protein